MKVYELAKKLEVKSVVLMDKIRRDWKIPVKTHMATLTPEMIKIIEDKFYSSQKSKAKTSPRKKKTIVKKSSAEKKTRPVKKRVVKKQSTDVKVKPDSSPVIKQKPEAQKAVSKVQRKVIIRRKKTSVSPKESSAKKVATPQKKSTELSSSRENTSASSLNPSMTSKNIRLDLVSVKTTDPLEEGFWDKAEGKQDESVKKQPKKPLAEKDISSKFNATDFRKREVIFQPRKKRTMTLGEFKRTPITTPKSHKRVIKIHGEMSIDGLCKKMGIKKTTLLKKLKTENMYTSGLSSLDFDTIALIVPAFGFEAKNTKQTEKEILEKWESSSKNNVTLVPKPPVVTIMGHVDHGKTTLLDYIRKSKVAQKEAGGITQHIGAYSVFLGKNPITFIDTPGHEAFTAMRSRGVQVTDIVVIIVAADDGVMPQTLEALNHAKAAKTPIIIAMSKMDTPGANPEKIKKQMSEQGIVPEDWGGDTSFIPISAVKGEGIQELLEQIQLVAEMQELKCQPEGSAKGVVIEARKEKGFGSIVSLLVKDGTLKLGQNIVAGDFTGRIRQMKNDQGKIIKEVQPGFPVEAIGFQELPQTGDSFYTVTNDKALKNWIAVKKEKNQNLKTPAQTLNSEEILLKMEQSQKQEFPVILKADVQGSLEALKTSLENIKSDEISIKLIHLGMGAISESDVLLASTVSGIIFGFNVRPDSKATKAAKEKSVEIHVHTVIYELLDQVKKLLLGLLKTEFTEEDQGQAEVREIFHISKGGTVAGCYVTSGQVSRHSLVRVVRDGRLIYDGKISGLKRFKDDVTQVGLGFECGLSLENFNDIKPKDIIESYIKKEKPRTEL